MKWLIIKPDRIPSRIYGTLLWIVVTLAMMTQGGTLWVDCALPVASTNTYSFAKRDNSGTDGTAYRSLHSALAVMVKGTNILLRKGTYPANGEGYTIPKSANGTAWTQGEYNKISSVDGEWAVLDGENNLENTTWSHLLGSTGTLNYLIVERLGFTRSRSADGQQMRGFWANGGPFKFRYCYFYDNRCDVPDENPCALGGGNWNNSLVEYCFFENNGSETVKHVNINHITTFGDYKRQKTSVNGFSYNGAGKHQMKNVFRCNLFKGGSAGIRIAKEEQFFCGRTLANGYNDNYKDFGDKVYKNIFINLNQAAVYTHQDFVQIHNNIIYKCESGIYPSTNRPHYKHCYYNNTLINLKEYGIFYSQAIEPSLVSNGPFETMLHGLVFNNIFDSCTYTDTWNKEEIGISVSENFSGAQQDSFIITRNYSYRPASHSNDANGTKVVSIRTGSTTTRYTITELTELPSRRTAKYWLNQYKNSNPLYQHTNSDSAGFYKTSALHVIKGDTTIGNAGIGGKHPYLVGDIIDTIPKYIGATDPNNPLSNQWVDDVLMLVNLGDTMPPYCNATARERPLIAVHGNRLVLHLDRPGSMQLTLSTIQGRTVATYGMRGARGQNPVRLSALRSLPAGLYCCTVRVAGGGASSVFFSRIVCASEARGN